MNFSHVVLSLWLLSGCASRSQFVPHSTASARLGVIAHPAVTAYQGDVDTITSAGGELIGWMRVHPSVAGRAASRYGATHVVVSLGGAITVKGVRGADRAFALMRVPEEAWTKLPDALRPHGHASALPASCTCTQDQEFGGGLSTQYSVRCGNEPLRPATPAETDISCEPL